MKEFQPDYTNILNAARNIQPQRMPLYEHNINIEFIEKILNKKIADLYEGDHEDKRQFFKDYVQFFKAMGYDTVSFEVCIGEAMPGSGALGNHKPGVIKTWQDFERYPWESIPHLFWKKSSEAFEILAQEMPEGMKAVGGPGNGVFECVQEVVGYTQLCYIRADDPKLYKALFDKVGEVMYHIWGSFLERFGDLYAVCRFGDDLGFKSSTLISPQDIRAYVIPQYKRIIDLIHSYKKPFLFHCCGDIFPVMDDLIDDAGIDAKHSNEDVIAPFKVWVEKYGDRIGNFGGVDVDVLCSGSRQEIREYVQQVIYYSIQHKGFALGSGNSIPGYVPVEGYLAMVETAREFRGE